MKRFRMKNPTPTQWAIIGTTGALVVGLAATAYAANRRLKRRGEPPTDPEIPPADEPPVEEPTQWQVIDPYDAGYPWEFPVLHFENYPTPGTWVNLNDTTGTWDPSKGFDSMVRATLGSALAMAGNDASIAFAQGQDPNASLGRNLRRAVREGIIAVGGVNDLTYGQTNLNLAGGNDPEMPGGNPEKPLSATYVLNPQGRGLNWNPRHADNLVRIQNQQPLKRTTNIVGQRLPPPNRGNQQMIVWLPALDLEALGPDRIVPEVRYLQWSDGSSTINPPPMIQQLGVDLSGVFVPV